jgi:hypothetical protein
MKKHLARELLLENRARHHVGRVLKENNAYTAAILEVAAGADGSYTPAEWDAFIKPLLACKLPVVQWLDGIPE